jgi:hypothetical protein
VKSKILQFAFSFLGLLIFAFSLGLPMAAGLPATAHAQTAGQSGGFVPCGNKVGEPCTVGHLFKGFVVIVNYLIVMAGFVAVLAIVYAGFMMVYSQGDDGGGLKEAKGRLSGAVIGLIIVAAAYILINALFAGSFSIGVCDGGTILTDPKAYIQGTGSCN